jgi:hypothetical protein
MTGARKLVQAKIAAGITHITGVRNRSLGRQPLATADAQKLFRH